MYSAIGLYVYGFPHERKNRYAGLDLFMLALFLRFRGLIPVVLTLRMHLYVFLT